MRLERHTNMRLGRSVRLLWGMPATLIAAALLSCAAAASAEQQGPRAVIETANRQISALLAKRVQPASAAARQREAELRQIVTSLLDLDAIAQAALGRNWEQRTPQEREEFSSLLRQLVERSYLRQAESNVDYTVEFIDVEVEGTSATVGTILHVRTSGRSEDVLVTYSLALREERWRVVDVDTDGVSMVRNYRTQFGRIITREGFPELISRMRRRLSEGAVDL